MRIWRQAARQLFRSPGYLAVAALALALGIGSTATIFSIVRAVFLRSLPSADAGSLVQGPASRSSRWSVSLSRPSVSRPPRCGIS